MNPKQKNGPPSAPEGAVRLALDVSATPAAEGEVGSYVDVIASTASRDRDGEIVEQDFDLSRTPSVPVYWEHNFAAGWGMDPYAPETTLPIGRAENLRVEDGALKARLFFVDEKANPLAPKVFEGFRQGSIKSVSIGFQPGDVRVEEIDGEEVLVLAQNELLEISACGIGINRDAGVEAISAKTFSALRARAKENGMIKGKKADAPPAGESTTTESAKGMKACESCKAEGASDAKFCAACGKAFPAPEAEKPATEEPAKSDPAAGEAKSFLATVGAKSFREAGAVFAAMQEKAAGYDRLEARVAEIESDRREGEVKSIVDEAIRTGYLRPAKKSEALAICGAGEDGKGADPDLLRRYVKSLPRVVEIDGKGAKTPAEAEDTEITPELRRVLKKSGITIEQYVENEKARAARKAGG